MSAHMGHKVNQFNSSETTQEVFIDSTQIWVEKKKKTYCMLEI
jgi:hypothetical protein